MKTDAERLQELADEFGADNPAVKMAEFTCTFYPSYLRHADYWKLVREQCEYCNEEIGDSVAYTVVSMPHEEELA